MTNPILVSCAYCCRSDSRSAEVGRQRWEGDGKRKARERYVRETNCFMKPTHPAFFPDIKGYSLSSYYFHQSLPCSTSNFFLLLSVTIYISCPISLEHMRHDSLWCSSHTPLCVWMERMKQREKDGGRQIQWNKGRVHSQPRGISRDEPESCVYPSGMWVGVWACVQPLYSLYSVFWECMLLAIIVAIMKACQYKCRLPL